MTLTRSSHPMIREYRFVPFVKDQLNPRPSRDKGIRRRERKDLRFFAGSGSSGLRRMAANAGLRVRELMAETTVEAVMVTANWR